MVSVPASLPEVEVLMIKIIGLNNRIGPTVAGSYELDPVPPLSINFGPFSFETGTVVAVLIIEAGCFLLL